MPRGLFISLEGGEGAGKSTQLAAIVEALAAAGREVVATREPGGTAGAEAIRDLLVEGEPGRWTPMTETLLHYAARVEHVERLVRPALRRGLDVVCDRFSDSTMAYQGFGQGVPREAIAALHRTVLGGFAPDLTLVLDVPVETGLGRAAARRDANRYERFDAAFHGRVREGFRTIAREEPSRCVLIDATRARDEVTREVLRAVGSRLGLVLGDPA